jgi:hypothetical protein
MGLGGQNLVQLLNKAGKVILINKEPREEKTTEEKLKEIDELESMINDPKQYEQIVKIIKWVTPYGRQLVTLNPNCIKEASQEVIKVKRMKAQLTLEQRACIKKVTY